MILFLMLAGHALADYPLQGDFLARGKMGAIPGFDWWVLLSMHALIHGGVVALVTGSLPLGVAEFVMHWLIDLGKNTGAFGFKADQALHLLCKLGWWAIYLAWYP